MRLLAPLFAVLVCANWVAFVAGTVFVVADFSVVRVFGFILHAVVSIGLFILMIRVLDSVPTR